MHVGIEFVLEIEVYMATNLKIVGLYSKQFFEAINDKNAAINYYAPPFSFKYNFAFRSGMERERRLAS